VRLVAWNDATVKGCVGVRLVADRDGTVKGVAGVGLGGLGLCGLNINLPVKA